MAVNMIIGVLEMVKKRLITSKPKGVMCKDCQYGHCVDAKRGKYYCIPPDSSNSWLYYGEHSCGNGVAK